MKSSKTLQQAIQFFSDPENCREFMISVRWPDGVVRCPHCDGENVTFLAKAHLYKCNAKHERQKFSLKVGTVMEDSALPLEKWLPALWLIASCKNGISSWEIHRALGVTQKTAWFMLHRARLAMKGEGMKLGGSDGGPVEVDETFVGGKIANTHKSKKLHLQQVRSGIRNRDAFGHIGKTAVMGMLDRDLRQVRCKVVPNIRREALQNAVLEHVHCGSKVYTDTHGAYDRLQNDFVHEMVNKAESYVREQVHVNGMENFWSLLKRTLKGTYVAVEPFHLERYLDEQMFRYNNRATRDNPLNDADRFHAVLAQIVGRRLTYAELTGKVGVASS
ncbi:MAG: IS1595 family transposase [Candidatus Korobacteraceae bacterium]